MAAEFRKAGKAFNIFLKLTLGSFMKLLFNYRIESGIPKDLKPPFIVVANHTNFYDPFLLSMCIREPVHFVTSDAYFRNPVLRFLLKYVGAIPKTKSISDPQSIKYILSAVKGKGVIGIFAEGRRSWDGSTLPLLFATAKLVKSLKIPVVSVLFKGACLSMPRWAKNTRKGELMMECRQILSSDEIEAMKAEDINKVMTASLAHDEYAWQKAAMVPFKGRKPAEKLELFLFLCPKCYSGNHMKSKEDLLFCTKCGYAVRYDKFGFFQPVSGETYHKNPRDWNRWQLEFLEKNILASPAGSMSEPLLEDFDVEASTGDRASPVKKFDTGCLRLYQDRIVFQGWEKGVLTFGLTDIAGENIQYNDRIEFYHDKALYSFGASHGTISAYKWIRAVEMVKTHYNHKTY